MGQREIEVLLYEYDLLRNDGQSVEKGHVSRLLFPSLHDIVTSIEQI